MKLLGVTLSAAADPTTEDALWRVLIEWADPDGMLTVMDALSLDPCALHSLVVGLFDEKWGPLDVIGWRNVTSWTSGSTIG